MWWTTLSEYKHHSINKFQNYKKPYNAHKIDKNIHSSSQFSTGALSFQLPQHVKPGDNISLNVNTNKHFLSKLGEKYTLQKSQQLH